MFDQNPDSHAIGGYFELELSGGSGRMHQNAFLFQSARGAFRALLQTKRPKKVWIPKYICNAMLSPLLDEGVGYAWYDLDNNLDISESVSLGEDDWLLYVNYFGVCQKSVDRLLRRRPANQIIFDFSQAFFDPPKQDALATIYSPRKFVGVPDGGMLVTNMAMKLPYVQDGDSLQRMAHLLKRLYDSPESGYSDYLSSENSLIDSVPKQMSGLTRRLLKSIDFNSVRDTRMENFNHLHKGLRKINLFDMDVSKLVSPLCYPFIAENEILRNYLIKNRVFVPTYWTDALNRVGRDWAARMIHNLLPIPLDQRYSTDDMDFIISKVMHGL